MSGLIGEPVGSIKHPVASKAFSHTPESVANYLSGTSAKECKVDIRKCYKESDDRDWRRGCEPGWIALGLAAGTAVPSKKVCPVRINMHQFVSTYWLISDRMAKDILYAVPRKVDQLIVCGEVARMGL
jgi:hypothetical protein